MIRTIETPSVETDDITPVTQDPQRESIDSWPSWSACNANECIPDKQGMANYFTGHSFLVQDGENPETSKRLRAASILVVPGTTPDTAVKGCLTWMDKCWGNYGPFSVMWYTPGALVATTLRDFRESHQHRRSAAELFLFPGQVDPDVEAVVGQVPVEFAKLQLNTRFTYSFLSSYTFDLEAGFAYFHYGQEVTVQRACAELDAAHKFLFVAPTKFRNIEGERGYSIIDLLRTANTVTIYTVQSDSDAEIKRQFISLHGRVLSKPEDGKTQRLKRLVLCIVGRDTCRADVVTGSGVLNSEVRPG